jgi:hypothetical protein
MFRARRRPTIPCEALEPRTLFAATTDQISEAIDLGSMTATRVVTDASIC